jgi:hypothetical protein
MADLMLFHHALCQTQGVPLNVGSQPTRWASMIIPW